MSRRWDILEEMKKEKEKMIQEIKQSEKEYEEFWYDPFCQSDCDDCEFD